jgi:hypothetical protein
MHKKGREKVLKFFKTFEYIFTFLAFNANSSPPDYVTGKYLIKIILLFVGRGSRLTVLIFLRNLCNSMPELEFLKSLWGLGTEEEEGYRTGPPGYIGCWNSFLGIDSGASYTFKNTGSEFFNIKGTVAPD